jgi:deazaflavin-dependent oxidoreductase (nitroreductase family)
VAKAPPRLFLKVVGGLHRVVYRLTRGRVGGRPARSPVLLLTTIGRRSGKRRTQPLFYLRDGANLVVIASYGGADIHPAWFLNIEAEPDVEVQVGGLRERRRARRATADEYERLWKQATAMYPTYDAYRAKTERAIPLVVLEDASS